MIDTSLLRNKTVRAWIDRLLFAAFLIATAWMVLFEDNTPPEKRKPSNVSGSSFAESETVRVLEIADGDEILIENQYRQRTVIRLAGIKAFSPEAGDPKAAEFGREAVLYLRQHTRGREAWLRLPHQKTDSRNRLIGRLHLLPTSTDEDGGSIALRLLQNGLVLLYPTDALAQKHIEHYRMTENAARRQAKGLWADPRLANLADRMKKHWKSKSPE